MHVPYYFEGNLDFAKQEMEQAEIEVTAEISEYLQEVLDYLETEYDSPYKYFLDFSPCEELVENLKSDISAKEYVDNTMQAASRSSMNSVL